MSIIATYFGLEGRNNRLEFFLRSLLVCFVGLCTCALLWSIFWFLHPMAGVGMALAASFITLGSHIALSVQRLHDLNWSGWWVLLLFVPGVNVVLILILLFIKGTHGPNRFGVDPCAPMLQGE